jgi:hypothetical protein
MTRIADEGRLPWDGRRGGPLTPSPPFKEVARP